MPRTLLPLALAFLLAPAAVQGADPWVVYEGTSGPGKGKHIVLVSGDEEYRSEEALPQLGKILAKHHGFKCTVLFAVDPATGEINPDRRDNIPGLEALESADLLLIGLRFRDLPAEQMKHFDAYLKRGGPIVALRTSTHAFQLRGESPFADWSNGAKDGGFGRRILGEKWVAHHGAHGRESTRGVIAPGQENHPIVRGIEPKTIWGPSDVYTVTLPLPGDSQPVVLGQVLTGMKQDDEPVAGKKNDPLMPVAWTKTYQHDGGKTGRVFTTTMGAATDLTAEGTRRMIVNGCYWALGMEDQIGEKSNVELVGDFDPSPFKFGGYRKGVKPSDHAWKP
jgi:type 1 glutamine amidotransferase